MTRDDTGTLVRDPSNPHGLGPMPNRDELRRRKRRLVKAKATALAALDRVEAIRLAHFDGEKAELPPLVWHEEAKP